MNTILTLLENDATLTPEQLAVMCNKETGEIRNAIAVYEKIYSYPEVQSLYLMSGGYDPCVQIEGKTIKEVACFVAGKLATIEKVVSTATHFVLRKYKDKGVVFGIEKCDKKGDCN